jgi:pimeloyl-ACP methyl ester carboxylesterase
LVTITTDRGLSLRARRTGHGAPVVLVHGSAGGLDSFDPVVPLLTDEYEVWVYARRGYAPSDDCPQAKVFGHDVADLEAVLDAAGGRAHLVGASYGGTVVLHAARVGLPGIRSVTLFEPPLFAAGAELTDVLEQYRALVGSGDLNAAARLFAGQVARVPATVLDGLPQAADEPSPRAAADARGCLHDLEAMAADELDIARWAGIDLPTLLMQGSDTWAPVPATMDRLAEALPSAARVVLPGQAHFATHTAPALFAKSLLDFLRGCG